MKRYRVTINWQATGYYTADVYADSEDEAIADAKDWSDDDLQSQMTDYRITDCDADHLIDCERCEDTGVVSTGLGIADPDDDEKPCPDCQ